MQTDVPSCPQVQMSMIQASDEVEEPNEPSFQDLGHQTGQWVDKYNEGYEECQPASNPWYQPTHTLLQAEATVMPTTQQLHTPLPVHDPNH